MILSANPPIATPNRSTDSHNPDACSQTRSNSAIATFTAGPASATHSSWMGSSGIRSSRVSPPIGRSVMSRVRIP